MSEGIGKKINNKEEKEKKIEEQEPVKFEDLPKKIQKKVIRGDFLRTRPVESKTIEKGTYEVLKIIKDNPGISRKTIIENTNFRKKKVKRILNQSTIMVNRKVIEKQEKYYYIGDKLL